jgi:hypothetical protein
MSVNVLGKTFELALLRAGPQDFPFMPNRHVMFGVVAGTPVFMVYSLALSPVIALSMALGTVLGIFLATRLILRWRKLDGRFAQTAHALMCTNALLTVLMILPFSQIAPLLSELAANPEAPVPTDIPGLPVMIMNVLNIWNFLITANVYRHATDRGFAMGLLYSLLSSGVVLATVLSFGLLLGGLGIGGA